MSSQQTYFIELLLIPKKERKAIRAMKPAINNRGVILAKDLFVDKKNLMNTDVIHINKNEDDFNYGKKKTPLKKTSSKKTKNWYCAVCCEDALKDIRLCAICGLYVSGEYVGATKKGIDLYIYPKCVQGFHVNARV